MQRSAKSAGSIGRGNLSRLSGGARRLPARLRRASAHACAAILAKQRALNYLLATFYAVHNIPFALRNAKLAIRADHIHRRSHAATERMSPNLISLQ
jgi:hypothetical protein